MLRVAGGDICGQRIQTPGDMIRPTQEKVRQALFSALGEKIGGCRFLDLFAGTGAVGIEAWSRGASVVCWVEMDARVFSVLRENVSHLCVSQRDGSGPDANAGQSMLKTIRGDAVKFVSKIGNESLPYDVIFADPPYDTRGDRAWLRKTLQALDTGSILAPDGIVVIEQSIDEPSLDCQGWTVIRDKNYGGTRLRFLKK